MDVLLRPPEETVWTPPEQLPSKGDVTKETTFTLSRSGERTYIKVP